MRTRTDRMHLDAEQVQRVVHGELRVSDARSIERHLAECDVCRDAVARARAAEDEMHVRFESLDHPVRVPNLAAVRNAARFATLRRRRYRWAAAIVASVGLTGIAYAVPSSTLARWIEERFRGAPHRSPPPADSTASAVRARETAPDVSGVSVDPGDSLAVRFVASQAAGVARVVLADVADLTVRSPGGAARFAVRPGSLTIDNRGMAADYEITVPRRSARVEIVVAGRRVWLRERGRVTSDAAPDADGSVRLTLTR